MIKKKNKFWLILIVILLWPIEQIYCTNPTGESATTALQDLVWSYVDNLNEEEVDELGREILRRGQPIEFGPRAAWPEQSNVQLQETTVWNRVISYVIIAGIIVIISIYHEQIINCLFNIGKTTITETIPTAVQGFNRVTSVRTMVTELMQNPEGRQIVFNAINAHSKGNFLIPT